jgi:hypothetical protein
MRDIKTQARYVLLLLALTVLTACPYPVYKKVQPEANILVLGTNQQALESAKVVLITRIHPTPNHLQTIKLTNASGLAKFDSMREMQIETTFLHGSLDYRWSWCVEKAGYQTAILEYSGKDLTVTLQPGESEPCDNR